MIKAKNIIFDLHGVIFEQNNFLLVDEKPFVKINQNIEILLELNSYNKHRFFACSNGPDTVVDFLKIEYKEIMDIFEDIITPSIAQAKKPDLRIFYYLLEKNDLKVEDTIFIDDQESNVIAAKNLLIHSFLSNDIILLKENLIKVGALL